MLLLVVLGGWFYTNVGPAPLAVGSGLVVLFTLFAAPMPCCAETRVEGQYCRRNGRGLLGGCHLQSHKWQNARAIVHRQSWARVARRVFSTVSGNATAISALAGVASAIAAVITLMLKSPPTTG